MLKVSDDEFVLIWNGASSRQDVADKCNVSGATAGMRAAKLRKAGVNLKHFQRGRPKKTIDVEHLNEIIEQAG